MFVVAVVKKGLPRIIVSTGSRLCYIIYGMNGYDGNRTLLLKILSWDEIGLSYM